MALTHTPTAEIGSSCPDFDLPAVDGKRYSLNSFEQARALVVMFICNHCPYVKAIEDRLIQLGLDLKSQNIAVIGICSNDPVNYPEDSFERLAERAQLKNYSFTYLHDLDQSVAKSFGAVCTPDFFVYDMQRRLQYRGRLDDSWKDPSKVTSRELHDASIQIAQGRGGPQMQSSSMGCSIKWTK
jgi:peroxiredoxin